MKLEKYDLTNIEHKWRERWKADNTFKWDGNKNREEVFSIDTPPPTVSGYLHMGHVFSYLQTDFIARYQRMRGKSVFYPIGFDDNGLPTERLVEKTHGVKGASMSREAFVDLCRGVVDEAEDIYRNIFDTIGLSVDFDLEYKTIDGDSYRIAQVSFIDLYNKGLAELREAPAFWDIVDRTAIAQAEIEDKEKSGVMNYINFSLDGSDGVVEIATTRPELLAACQCIFYHPEDARYKMLEERSAIVPLFGKYVPCLADESVDMEKGSGAVMCCTFGDIQDIEWWKKHSLDITSCVLPNGTMQNCGTYDGMKIKEARKQILDDLRLLPNTLVKQEDIKQYVKCAERSGAPLEIIVTSQWYIKVLDLKEQLKKLSSQLNWYPEYMQVRLLQWIDGLNQDWCISRQRFFGIPFPVWYSKREGEEGKIILPKAEELPVDPLSFTPAGYSPEEVTPSTDVMDTWATSALTPQINCKHIDGADNLFPMDLRPQAHEIIRTWTFYTMVKAWYHDGSLPWKNVMLSGWCLAADKSKMSKSKGNVITPISLIENFGVDVTRYWASTSRLGVDTAYSEDMFKIGKKLITKLWNAAKFCQMHINPDSSDITSVTEDLDKWALSKLSEVIGLTESAFDAFEYAVAREKVEKFFWDIFCDNYIELIKKRIYASNVSASTALYRIIDVLLRLFAPFIPHVCEEIHEHIFGFPEPICSKGMWPRFEYMDEAAVMQGDLTIEILALIRQYKSNNNMPLNAGLEKVRIFLGGPHISASTLQDLKNAAGAKEIELVEATAGNNTPTIEVVTASTDV